MRARRYCTIATAFVAVALSGEAMAQPRPAGGDFQVNTYTTGEQSVGSASVAMNEATGDFLVVWKSMGQDGDDAGVFAQRYDRFATPLGAELQVNTTTSGHQGENSFNNIQIDATMRDDGSFLVVWNGNDNVFARLFDTAGVAAGPELQVDLSVPAQDDKPRVDHDGAGNFVIVWESSNNQDGSGHGILGRRLDASATPVGTEFQVNTYTTGNQYLPDVAVVPDGTFVVTWASTSLAAGVEDHNDVIARRFAADATPLGGEQVIPVQNDLNEWFPRIDNDAVGNFIVKFTRAPLQYFQSNEFARHLDSTGTPIGSELTVGEGIAMAPDGSYVLTDIYAAGESQAQRFDAADQPLGAPFGIQGDLANYTYGARSIDMDANGNFVVAFHRDPTPQLGEGGLEDFDVVARRFCDSGDPTCDVCAGFDDTIDGDGDGSPDGCDPCTDLALGQHFVRLDASVRYGGFDDLKDVPLKLNRVRMKGDVTLPGLFAGFEPVTDGVRVRVEAPYDGSVVDVALPGGSYGGAGTRGWRLNGPGTTWVYIDSTTERINGFSKITVKDRSNASPGAVRLIVKAGGGIYGTNEGYLPLEAMFVFGDQAAADAGQCALLAFDLAECEAHNPFGNMRCRR